MKIFYKHSAYETKTDESFVHDDGKGRGGEGVINCISGSRSRKCNTKTVASVIHWWCLTQWSMQFGQIRTEPKGGCYGNEERQLGGWWVETQVLYANSFGHENQCDNDWDDFPDQLHSEENQQIMTEFVHRSAVITCWSIQPIIGAHEGLCEDL